MIMTMATAITATITATTTPITTTCNRHDASIRAFALTAGQPVAQATFDLFWTLLRSTHGSKLLRLKGLVRLSEHPGRPLLVHAVQQILHPPVLLDAWPDADRRSRLVLIVKDIERGVVAAALGRPSSARWPAAA